MIRQYTILTYRCVCKFKHRIDFYGHISNAENHMACPSCKANDLKLDSYEIIVGNDVDNVRR